MKYSKTYSLDIEKTISAVPNIGRLKEKAILITGATGMIGSAIADTLLYLKTEKNFNIQIYLAGRNQEKIEKRFFKYQKEKDYIFVQFDAINISSFDIKIDYIIHAASNADPFSFNKEPVETILANINGLYSLLQTAKKQKSLRLLYISSSEVYGQKMTVQSYREDDYGFVDILNPRSCYPNSKRAAETLCVAYQKEYKVDTVIVRPGHIYGPTMTSSDSRASSQFPRDVIEGHNIVMKSLGTQLRSYCYVLDCVSAIITVLLNGNSGEAYNISNKNSIVSIREMAEAFAKAGNVILKIGKPSDEEKKGYNPMSNSSLDSTRLEKLGWKPLFDLMDGVKKTLLDY
jgi:nucleoside-diphosphate-sugar epimerase